MKGTPFLTTELQLTHAEAVVGIKESLWQSSQWQVMQRLCQNLDSCPIQVSSLFLIQFRNTHYIYMPCLIISFNLEQFLGPFRSITSLSLRVHAFIVQENPQPEFIQYFLIIICWSRIIGMNTTEKFLALLSALHQKEHDGHACSVIDQMFVFP